MATNRTPRVALSDMVASAVALQDQIRNDQRHYQVLGRLYAIECEKGRVHFDEHNGPGIAQEVDANGDPTGVLVFVSAWKDLPQVPTHSEEFCAACLAPCDICGGKGKALCIYTGCGGRGTLQAGEIPCSECVAQKGKFDLSCKTCGGYGAVPNFIPCPSCRGTGQAKCGSCRGKGVRPSGKNNRAARKFTRPSEQFPKGRSIFALPGMELDSIGKCTSCQGTQRAGKWVAQDLTKIIAGRIGNYASIGPVVRLVVTPAPATDAKFASRWNTSDRREVGGAFLRIYPERDRAGQAMMILLPIVSHGELMPYFYGGTIL